MAEFDVELALLDYPKHKMPALISALPANYVLEDKYELGWGAVIRTTDNLPDSIDEAVCAFLEKLDKITAIVRDYDGVLRVGIFYDTATLTFRLGSVSLLDRFSLDLEVSAYPSTD